MSVRYVYCLSLKPRATVISAAGRWRGAIGSHTVMITIPALIPKGSLRANLLSKSNPLVNSWLSLYNHSTPSLRHMPKPGLVTSCCSCCVSPIWSVAQAQEQATSYQVLSAFTRNHVRFGEFRPFVKIPLLGGTMTFDVLPLHCWWWWTICPRQPHMPLTSFWLESFPHMA